MQGHPIAKISFVCKQSSFLLINDNRDCLKFNPIDGIEPRDGK